MKLIIDEQFNDFPLKEFPYDKNHSAVGEYHHLMPDGYMGNFYDPVNNHQWRSLDGSWLVTEINGIRYMEQNRGHYTRGYFENLACLLVLQNINIGNFTIETELTLLSTRYYSGIAFLYLHSQKYYAVKLTKDKVILYFKNQDKEIVLEEVDFISKSLENYSLKIIKSNQNIKVIVNNDKVIDYEGEVLVNSGSIGLLSINPARYKHLKVFQTMGDYQADNIKNKLHLEDIKLEQSKLPSLKVIKKINLQGYGSARQMRIFKHNGVNYFIFAQHDKKIFRDAFANISCLTCIDENGNIIWQIGKANENIENSLISADLPFQVSDMNNDGIPELIYAKDFEIIISNALTGEVIKKTKTPYVKDDKLVASDYPYDYLNVDAIRVADFTGLGYQSDFIIKDRYHNVWAYDFNFNLLFRYNHKNTGHFPYIYDFDKDGKDEMLVGYDFVKDGKIIWSLPFNSDHTDEIIWGPLKEDGKNVILLASGNEGFNVVDINGSVIKSIPVGHAQRISLAKYDVNREGYQVCVTSFWGANGIIYTFDSDLELIAEREMVGNGNIITPVNYDNSGQILILGSTDPKYGGLYNVNLEKVVSFPNDNHPTLASEALDLDNDGITEILTWDQNELWIYKASNIRVNKLRTFYQYPNNAFSNYRGEFLIEKKGRD